MIKIASITYLKETGKSPYKFRFGILKCYTEDYVSWLIGKWNESRELSNNHKVEKLTKEQVESNRSSAYSYMKLKK